MEYLRSTLSGKVLNSSSLLNDSFARYRILGWQVFFFFFSTLNISAHCLLASEFSDEKSVDNFIQDPLYVLILVPTSCMLAALYVAICQVPGWGWITATTLRAEFNSNFLLEPSFDSWKTSMDHSFKIITWDRFCQCICCSTGETNSWRFLFYYLLRILFHFVLCYSFFLSLKNFSLLWSYFYWAQ